jgi:hypothetical protein
MVKLLMVDTPGSGEALWLRGPTARYDTEAWAGIMADWIAETFSSVDSDAVACSL